MNKRQAGEDFYFLHKLARERPLGHLGTVVVYPSARMSSRTPFGTGQAISDWYHSEQSIWPVCAPESFIELKQMNDTLHQLFDMDTANWLAALPAELHAYLLASNIEKAVTGMRANASSPISFCNRFYFWFDGLKAWRYVNRQATVPVEQAIPALLSWMHISPAADQAEALLDQLRTIRP